MAKNKKATVKRALKPQATLDTHIVRRTRASESLLNDQLNINDEDKMLDSSSESNIGYMDSPKVATTTAKIGRNEEDVIMVDRSIAKEHTATQEITDNYNKEIGEVNLNVENPKNNSTTNHLQNNVKKINPTSRNRRVCNRILMQNRDTTPERQNTRTYQHVFKTRVTVKLTLTDTGDMHQSIRDALKSLLTALTKSDPSVTIMPWVAKSHLKELHRPEEVPHMINSMRSYVNKLFVPGEGRNRVIYPNMMIGHDDSLEVLKEKLSIWMRETNSGLYYKMLQVEEGTEVGWLLYSTREMDAGALADEIEDILGFPVGLKWKVIDTGVRGRMNESQKVQALTVEVEAKYQWKYQRTIAQFYCRTIKDTSEYPNGLRLRFVKRKADAINIKEKGKIDALRRRQQLFLKGIRSSTSHDINQIDYSSNRGKEPTLRQMIMNIKQHGSNVPLFHNVDLDWKGEAYNFQYHSKMKDEAECIINTLIPYLSHHYPTIEVEKYFTEEAAFKSEGLQFDPNTNMVTDSLISEIDVEGIENLPGFEIEETDIGINSVAPNREVKTFMPGDDDSVSTLGNRFTPQKRARPPTYGLTATSSGRDKDNDSNSEPSSIGNTQDSSSYEQQINGLETKLLAQEQKINDQYKEILQILQKVGSNDSAPTLQNSQSSRNVQNSGVQENPGEGL